MTHDLSVRFRIPLLAAGFVSLLFGIVAGLVRMGWHFLSLPIDVAAVHGPLMVCSFLGTVISLERAVALGRRWAYLGPLLAALGGLLLVAGQHSSAAMLFILAASIVLTVTTMVIVLRQFAPFTITLLLGSLFWLIGNILWLEGMEIRRIIPWWTGFLVLTIAGERLELSRLLPPSRAGKNAFMAIIALLLMGAVTNSLTTTANLQPYSLALVALALWLCTQDIAIHTIRQKGLTRFIAACLLSGYAWLLIGGVVGLISRDLVPGTSYDAFLHSILVGFVFSMIFGHAPIIFPAITKIRMRYHPLLYLPVAALHTSLICRIAGDLLDAPQARTVGGAMNGIAFLLFVLIAATLAIRNKPAIKISSPPY